MNRGRAASVLVGLVGTALVIGAALLLGDAMDEAITALLLLLPITASSVLGGWRPAVLVAVVAALTHALTILTPVGRVRIGFTHDVLVLITFVIVALVIGIVSGRRTDGAVVVIEDGNRLAMRAVSHDLRSPLSTIRAASIDLLAGVHDDEETRRRLLGLVVSESERLDRIVGNLLSADRLRSGTLTPDTSAQSIAAVLTDAVARLARVVKPPILLDIEPSLPDVMIDAVLIDQVVANLVENAAAATPTGEPIVVTARRCEAGVDVVVADRGPGFARGADADPFVPQHSTRGSSGLGLSICRAIVEAQGGTIGIDRRPGGGGQVRFTVLVG